MLLQKEVELRASVLCVHRLAVATRSRSSPLPGFDLISSSAESSKPGSKESSADQAAALARALTVHNPAAAAAEHDVAVATFDQDAAAAAGIAGQQQLQPSSSSSYRRAMTWGAEPDSSKGSGAGHFTFLHVQQNIDDLEAAAAAIAALDARPSALYKTAAEVMGDMSRAGVASSSANEQGAGTTVRCKPRVSFAIPVEGSRCLQEQLWSHTYGAGPECATAAAAAAGSGKAKGTLPAGPASILEMVPMTTLQLSQQQQKQHVQQQALLAGPAAADVGSNSPYTSAESLLEAAAATCSSKLDQQQQPATRRTFTNLAAPATPVLRDVLSSSSTIVQDAATDGCKDQVTARMSSMSSSSDGHVSSSSGCRRLEFSAVLDDVGFLQAAATASSQAPPDVQPQQQVLLHNGPSTCYVEDDAYKHHCLADTAMEQQQLQGRLGRITPQQEHAAQQAQLATSACTKGNSSSHSRSTHTSLTSAFQSTCSFWSPAE
jgi:hypothetical protein